MFNLFNFFSWFKVVDDGPDPWETVTSIVVAKKIVADYRAGNKVDPAVLKIACDACDIEIGVALRDHNRAHWLRHNMVA